MAQEQLIRSFYDTVNNHDIVKFTTYFSDDGHFKDVSSEKIYRGKSEIRAMAESWLKAIPDMKLQVSSIIGSGDVCCVELSLVGTHTGPLEGPSGTVPASGNKVNVPSCDVLRFKNGKIQSLNCYYAATVLLNQIGAMPARQAA